MKITELTLDNFMIYKGNQIVNFAREERNITLIFGENMQGKTTLLNSIRWCLYGEAKNRQGSRLPDSALINIEAFREGVRDVGVKLKFSLDENEHELIRKIDLSVSPPKHKQALRINDNFIEIEKIDDLIETILPERLAQFMLFDGETLNNYEKLVVSEGNPQAIAIMNAIEETLGLPRIRGALFETEKVVNELKKERKAELAKNAIVKQLIVKLTEQEDLKAENLTIKKKKSKELQTLSEELSTLDEKLRENNENIKLLEQIKSKKQIIQKLENEQRNVRDDYKKIAKDLWVAPLRKAVFPYQMQYKDKLLKLENEQIDHLKRENEITSLELALLNDSCPMCGGSLTSSQKNDFNARITDLRKVVAPSNNIENEIFVCRKKIDDLELKPEWHNTTNEYKIFLHRDNAISEELLELENQINNLKESLKGIDQEQSINVKLRYDQVNKEMGILEHECSDLDTEYGQIENSIRAIRKSSEFEKASKTSDAVKRTEAAERVADLLQEAMRLYRDEMRRKVQERATETFGNLTTEKTFDRLEINDNYGLNLIIDKERVHRSAGAEQIVAMSLIEALNFNGRRVGPMIMDTPVGRLDKSHRANILNYLPRVVTQLALFSHSGEIDEGSNLVDNRLVGKKYRISRETSFRSKIEEII